MVSALSGLNLPHDKTVTVGKSGRCGSQSDEPFGFQLRKTPSGDDDLGVVSRVD